MTITEAIKNRPLTLDGSMSTPLEALGAKTNNPLWTAQALIDHEDLIYQVHMDYLQAGADIITTNTYQANVQAFVKEGYSEEEALELIKKAVRIAKKARDDYEKISGRHAYIAGSIGPYGAYLADGSEYTGNYTRAPYELQAFHNPRLQAIMAEGVDCLAIETQPKLGEVLALLAELQHSYPKIPVFVSFSLKDSQTISDGTALSFSVEEVDRYQQVFAIGVNCTNLEVVPDAIRILKYSSQEPIVVYPNSGAQYDPETKTWTTQAGALDFHSEFPKWYQAGARLIGGCCTTMPANIAEIANFLAKKIS